uniref:Reverse transcriptase/retrotransposon-derived protein RNase H-like domain-containing protein n=1 Tax=Crocodylus porosus TaxID=8502 RepID=A0A7M4ESK6_CROPO
MVKPLVQTTQKGEPEVVQWTPELDHAFHQVKRQLSQAPALGLPSYKKPFVLFVHKRRGVASGVLTQKLGPQLHPIAYYSATLDPVAKGVVSCLRAAAAAALLDHTEAVHCCNLHGALVMCPLHVLLF